MKKIEFNCHLCGSTDFRKITNYKSINKIFEKKIIIECERCSIKLIYPIPDEKKLKEYNENYFLNAHKDIKLDKIAETYFNCIAKCRVNFLESFIKKKNINIKQVLEIGPGKGYFYKNFTKNNKVTYSVLETDLNLQKVYQEKKIKVYKQYEQISENQYDLIIFSHVLEHISNPNNFLKKINKYLKKGGVIFLEVPCLDYLYKDLVEPHIFFYDKKSLSNLLSINDFNKHNIFYFGKKIEEMKNKNLNKQFKFKFTNLLLKLNLDFLINCKNEHEYTFLKNKNEKIIANMYEMNSAKNEPSWWIRALAIKN